MSAPKPVSLLCSCSLQSVGCVGIAKIDPDNTCFGAALPTPAVANRERWLLSAGCFRLVAEIKNAKG